jgi:hypothetical protein
MKLIVVGVLLVAGFAEGAEGADLFLAVGYGGRRMVSTDGLNWEITAEWAQPGGDDGNNLMSAVYAEDKFVVVGGGGGGSTGAGHILVSRDGREWNEVHRDRARINPIVHGDGRFVVGASSYPSGKFLWSDEGETWNAGAQIQARGLTHFRNGAFGDGRFVFVGNGQRKKDDGTPEGFSWAVVTRDGETIEGERTDLPGHGTIVFGAGRFLLLTSHDKADLVTSTDGLDWKRVEVEGDVKFYWLVWADDAFLAGAGQTVYRSTDGLKWTKTELTAPRGGVRWSDGRRFIASGWPGKMAYSPDGKAWELSPPMTANGINRVVRGVKP